MVLNLKDEKNMLQEAYCYVRSCTEFTPKAAIVLGSGFFECVKTYNILIVNYSI